MGKPAPPMPTMPHCLTISAISSFETALGSRISPKPGAHSFSKSFCTIMHLLIAPVTVWRSSIIFTLPETELKIGLEINEAASPIFIPTSTRSPILTVGTAGAPICWLIGNTISGAASIFIIFSFSENAFPSNGCTPALNGTLFISITLLHADAPSACSFLIIS